MSFEQRTRRAVSVFQPCADRRWSSHRLINGGSKVQSLQSFFNSSAFKVSSSKLLNLATSVIVMSFCLFLLPMITVISVMYQELSIINIITIIIFKPTLYSLGNLPFGHSACDQFGAGTEPAIFRLLSNSSHLLRTQRTS